MKHDMLQGKSDMCRISKSRKLGKVASILKKKKRKIIQRKSQFIKGLQTSK